MDIKHLLLCVFSGFVVGFCSSEELPDGTTEHSTSSIVLSTCKFDQDLPDKVEGPKGQKGEKGVKGRPGADGSNGLEGSMGQKGSKGGIGFSGSSGKDGSCHKTCTPDLFTDDGDSTSKFSDGVRGKFGTSSNPSPSLCHVRKNAEEFDGITWINPNKPFKVWCEKETGQTCLFKPSLSEKDFDYSTHAINYTEEITPFWFSHKKHVTEELYGSRTHQIEWLQEQASMVTQKIKYHCWNSHLTEDPNTALRMLGYSDGIIRHHTDRLSSFSYSWSANACKEDAPIEEWRHTEITIKSNTPKRLPVIDFQIRDIREGVKLASVEVVELCFR